MRRGLLVLTFLLFQWSFPGVAEESVTEDVITLPGWTTGLNGVPEGPPEAPGYLARLELNTAKELLGALKRAEMLFFDGSFQSQLPPATIVVHGPEVAVFFKHNYHKHKELVDLAARLSAFKVVDIRVCETRTGVLGYDLDALVPFVGTVPFGPDEVRRLVEDEGYLYF
ncbi:acyl-CoA transferase [Aestuariicella hydrocarbonica]|uniref:Acyl-CoA transferase n=1 Tax=Pseudomaricurvus hydrocarbonicus TaxID=1470433 RepID=A0A9E5T4P9_9GAMM|nr:acyl-CoA transferase [Aestuariicella hydrocarbonica]NHO68192.1 acyl-CoA transferase [Aestuariicella hydrocarbonica]